MTSLCKFPFSIDKIEYSPFTSILKFKNLSLGYKESPFIEGGNATCKVDSLLGLLSGKINFSDISVDGVTFKAVKFANGKWNFPWMNGIEYNFTEPPVSLKLADLNIRNAKALLEIKRKKPAESSTVEVYNLHLKSSLFASIHQTKIDYNGLVKVSSGNKVQVKSGFISGCISSYFNEWILPNSLVSNFHLDNLDGIINNLSIKDNSLDFTTDIYTEGQELKIKNISFQEKHSNKITSDISVSGYINSLFNKGSLRISAIPVSNKIINLFSEVFANYNFGNMKLYYDGYLDFTKTDLTNKGKLVINDFQINRNVNVSTSSKMDYDINMDYSLNYKYKTSVFCLENLSSFFSKNLVDQKDKFDFKHAEKALTLSISNPIYLKLKNSNVNLIGTKLKGKIRLNDLDIRFLNSFLVDLPNINVFSGISNGVFDFEVDPSYNSVDFKGKFNTDNFSFRIGNYKHNNVHLIQSFNCTLHDFRNLKLSPFNAKLITKDEEIFKSVITGNIDLFDRAACLKIAIPLISDSFIDYLPEPVRSNKIFKVILDQFKPFHISGYSSINLNLKKKAGSIGNAELTLNTPKYKNATLQLKNLIPFVWNSKKIEFKKNISTNLKLDDLNLTLFNIFMPKKSSFRFTKGFINTSINCLFDKHLSSVKIDGKINMPSFEIKYANNTFDDIDINAIYNFNIDTNRNKLTFKNTNIILDTKLKNVLSLETFGSYMLNSNELIFNGNIFNLNKEILFFFPGIHFSNINQLNATGQLNIKVSDKIKKMYAFLKLNKMSYFSEKKEKNITPFDSGVVTLNISHNERLTDIERIFLNFKKNNAVVFNLALSGIIPNLPSSGKCTFDVTSNILYLNFIKEMTTAFRKNKKIISKTNSSETIKTEAVKNDNLENIDFRGNIKLDNIIFSPQTKAKVNAAVNIKTSILQISPITASVNDSPGKGSFLLNLGYDNVYPYVFKANWEDLPISNLLNIFDINNRDIKGNITDLKMQFSGIGLPFSKSAHKTLKGSLTADAENIVLPVYLTKYGIFKIMFIPVEVLSRLRQMLPAGFTPSSIRNTLTSTSKIFTKMEQITFKKAKIHIDADNNIKLTNVIFNGGSDDLIKLMKFSGNIYLDKKIDIDAFSNVSGLQFPLKIYGTIDNPETNTQKFIYEFMKDNVINIFDPQNILDIINDTGKGIMKTFDGTANYIITPVEKD